jgi:hypothetical protein
VKIFFDAGQYRGRTPETGTMAPPTKTPWIELHVWAYEANGARTVNARRSLAALSAWRHGTRPPGTSFVAGSRIVDDPGRIDWQDFPEIEAHEAEIELLGGCARNDDRVRTHRPASTVQIETLREIGRDPEGLVRSRLHGARANALLQRGLIELAHVSGQTVRRISATGRELLHHLDVAGGSGRRRRGVKSD